MAVGLVGVPLVGVPLVGGSSYQSCIVHLVLVCVQRGLGPYVPCHMYKHLLPSLHHPALRAVLPFLVSGSLHLSSHDITMMSCQQLVQLPVDTLNNNASNWNIKILF